MPTALITGANRGLGLEFTRQYAADGWTVHATCRDPEGAGALKALGGDVHVHALDVAEPEQLHYLAAGLGDTPIDVLINNAGIFGDRSGFGGVDLDAWGRAFQVNTIAPYRVALALVDNVAKSEQKVIANVTSKMGSIADNTSGGCYVYRSSKAALNMVTKSLALDLAGRGIKAIVLHPGWVATDMGGAGAPLQPQPSIAGMRQVIAGLDASKSGRFWNYDGTEVPW
jgi:NAD(P)-dependent dehydrogenase (short-subunit alcohol dehydrogenase family)